MMEIRARQQKCIAEGHVSPNDEAAMCRAGRHAGATDSLWRACKFPIVRMSAPTICLPTHLPERDITFHPGQTLQAASVPPKKSALEAFFELNQDPSLNGVPLHYNEVSKYFVWGTSEL